MLQQKKEKEGYRHLFRYPTNKQKEEGDNSVLVVAFFAMLKPKKKKKVMVTMLPSPSSLRCNEKKKR